MYYILKGQPRGDPTPLARIGENPELDTGPWFMGSKFKDTVPTPLRFVLDPTADGPLGDFMDGTIPLMHEDLLAVLHGAGVDNLDLYDAVIVDEDTGEEYTEYKAVNVIGAVAAADLSKSDYTSHQPTPIVSVDFDSLAIDPVKAGGRLLFRLAECVTAIVIHEKVKAALEANDMYVGCIDPAHFIG